MGVTFVCFFRHVCGSLASAEWFTKMDDETTLLDAARKLDQDALIAVFDLYAPILYKYAMRLCGDSTESDDIVGDVFAELLKQLKVGKGPRDNLRSYLYQIAYHKIVDHSRVSKYFTGLEDSIPSSGEDSPHTQQESREEKDMLEAVIQTSLTEDQKHVIALRFIDGFSVNETAQIMDKSVNNVKVIQNRAIEKLRQVLGQQS